MNEQEHIIPSGPFKGKKIEFAPTRGVDMFADVAEEFIGKVFGFAPGDYLITDESSLHDFTSLGDDVADVHEKIRLVYDIDVSDIESGNLYEIFLRIHRQKYGEPS